MIRNFALSTDREHAREDGLLSRGADEGHPYVAMNLGVLIGSLNTYRDRFGSSISSAVVTSSQGVLSLTDITWARSANRPIAKMRLVSTRLSPTGQMDSFSCAAIQVAAVPRTS